MSPTLFLFFTAPSLERIKLQNGTAAILCLYMSMTCTCWLSRRGRYQFNRTVLARTHKVIMDWARSTGVMFSPEKYQLIHFKKPGYNGEEKTSWFRHPWAGSAKACLRTEIKILGVMIDHRL